MSNERKMLKITIEAPGKETMVINTHGFAGVALAGEEDEHDSQVMLMGSFNVPALITLHGGIEDLLNTIRKETVKDFFGGILDAVEDKSEDNSENREDN